MEQDDDDSEDSAYEEDEGRAEVDCEEEDEAEVAADLEGLTGAELPKKRFIGSSLKAGGSGGGAHEDDRVRELECPVCARTFQSSPAAMAAHVAAHFGGSLFPPPGVVH